MKTEVFIHQNQRVSYADAYSDVNGCPPVSAESICETCTNLLESAYVFRKMCRVPDQPYYNICLCCLQEKSNSNDQFLNFKTAIFEHNNKIILFFVGYFDVNNYSLEDSVDFTISEVRICEDCALQLKSAYAFRRMCQKTAEILQQTSEQSERQHNKESGQECTNTKKRRKTDKHRIVIRIKAGQLNLKSRRPHDIHQFSFLCTKCPKTFKNKIELSSHRKIKHKDVRTTRDLYARVWKRKSTLRLTGRIKQNFCEKCQIVFKTRQSYFSHIRSVHQMDSNKVFNSNPGLNVLKKSFHQKLQYRCKECPKAFQFKFSLSTHVHKDHLNISYDCKDCDIVFNTSAGLYQHNLGHGKPLHQCQKCPKAFRRRPYLLQHIRNIHENLEYPCQDCDKVFKSSDTLYYHKNTVHLKKLFKCKVCDKIYKNSTGLRTHTNKHLNRNFQCEKCSKIYLRKDHFIMHYQSKHLNILFACQDCDRVFTSRSGRIRHKASIHLEIMHQCEQCPKTFSRKGSLREHVENIHEKKQFCCQDCKKVYKSLSELTFHKKITHLKKLLKCKNCEKTFTNYYSRKSHNAKEHLKLTFECQKCKRKLANKKTLADHMQKIHPNDPWAC
jgi:uncharacterized C2H2 Zn-finger protein